MTETRPTGEQLRFVSSQTGEHILDDYMEAAEKGGRTLSDLLADVFDDTTGLFRADLFQFRLNDSNRTLEFRSGDFASPSDGWTPVQNGTVINWRGTYASGTQYAETDIVKHNASIYICTQAHTSSTPAPGPDFSMMIYAEDIRGPQPEVSASINFVIDGGEIPITPGLKGAISIPFGCTIDSWTIIASETGSCVLDIQKSSYANYPTTASITAAAKPTLSAAQKATSSTLTGWTTSIAANDILAFNVDSASTIKRLTISLKITRA